MRSINKVILIGNLTRDPELKQTPNGQSIVTFGLATNREWITKDGKKQTSAEFHDLVAWAKLAEICYKYLKKGKLVYIEGYLKTRSWEKDGVKKFRTEIVVQDMIMLNKKEQGNEEYLPEEEITEPTEDEIKNTEENTQPLEEKEETETTNNQEESNSNNEQKLDIDSDLGL